MVTCVSHFIYLTDKQKEYSRLQEKIYQIIQFRLNIEIKECKTDDDDDEYIVIGVDSTGIKVTKRGQWMPEKWNTQKKGYLKIQVAVNIKTKEILAPEVTDEKIHDSSKMLKKLVNQVLKIKSHRIKIRSVLADGAHDTNKNFQYLEDKRITQE